MSSGTEQIPDIEEIEIDFLIVADWAETVNGKLYIQGAAWDRKLQTSPDGRRFAFAIAAGILVPWHLTNQEHSFCLTLESGDGHPVGQGITGGFTMGRPAKAYPGQRLRTPLAGGIDLSNVPELGAHIVRLTVNGNVEKSVTFYVVGEL